MTETSNPWDALVAPATRTPRSLETRELNERKRSWTQPSVLPEIEPRDGWSHKWVRTDYNNQADKRNYSNRLREGWEPIDIADYPELQAYSADGKEHGHVEVGGLIACRMPAEMVKERNEHYLGVARQQESSAEEHYMRDPGEVVKKFTENSRKTVFGPSGR
jgi:hypothetical protein